MNAIEVSGMKRATIFFSPKACVLALLVLSGSVPFLRAEDSVGTSEIASAMLEKVDSYRSFGGSGFSYDFATSEDGSESSLMRVFVHSRGTESVLVKYVEPIKERGRTLFLRGNAFWLYEPGMKNAIRVSPRQLLFGQASAGDISRISFRAMYDIESVLGAKGGGQSFKLKAKANVGATYDLVELRTDAEMRPQVAECRGSSGTLIKTIRYTGYESIDGKQLLTAFTISDAICGKTTAVHLSNFSSEIPAESAFSIQALKYNR
jgi:hypothetical protein